MSHDRTGWYFPDDALDSAKAARSQWAGLPTHVVDQIGDNPVAGTSGILYYFNHLLHWEGPLAEGASAGWVLSGTTGTATITQSNVRSGEIVLTGGSTDLCNPTLALGGAAAPAPFIYSVGKRLWFAARVALGAVGSTEVFLGIGTPDTAPTNTNTFPSDGIFFQKASTATTLAFDARKDGTSTSKAAATGTLTDGTYTTLGFVVDALGNIMPYQDGTALTASVIPVGTANIPSAAADVMQPMIGILGGSGGGPTFGVTMKIDYLLFAQDI